MESKISTGLKQDLSVQEPSELITVSDTDALAFHFNEAVRLLDASIVAPYIPENLQLQDMGKYSFLAFHKTVFENTRLKCRDAQRAEPAVLHCLQCHPGRPLKAYAYYGGPAVHPFAQLGVVVETDDNDETTDIHICYLFRDKTCLTCN